MCGIFGFKLNRPLREEDLRRGRAGMDMLRHRGPDGHGEWYLSGEGVFLGHTRLAVIDLTDESAQPMTRGDATVAFNGEIYNYRGIAR